MEEDFSHRWTPMNTDKAPRSEPLEFTLRVSAPEGMRRFSSRTATGERDETKKQSRNPESAKARKKTRVSRLGGLAGFATESGGQPTRFGLRSWRPGGSDWALAARGGSAVRAVMLSTQRRQGAKAQGRNGRSGVSGTWTAQGRGVGGRQRAAREGNGWWLGPRRGARGRSNHERPKARKERREAAALC